MSTVRRFYNVRMVDTYDVGDGEIDAVRALIEAGDDESLTLADDIVTHHGTFIGTDGGDIDPTNEMLDLHIEED